MVLKLNLVVEGITSGDKVSFSRGWKNISTRIAKYFHEEGKLFPRGWRNISTRMAKCYHVDGIHQSFQDNHHDEVDESVVNDYVTRIREAIH